MEPVFNNPWVFDSGATLADVLPDSPHFFVAPAVNLEKMRVPVSRTLLFILDLLFSIDEQHGVKSCGDLAQKCVMFLSSCRFPLNSSSHSSQNSASLCCADSENSDDALASAKDMPCRAVS